MICLFEEEVNHILFGSVSNKMHRLFKSIQDQTRNAAVMSYQANHCNLLEDVDLHGEVHHVAISHGCVAIANVCATPVLSL